MTGTIDEPALSTEGTGGSALVEQAKGVLIFRYSLTADAAFSLLELWAAEYGAPVEDVARTVVREICQDQRLESSDARLIRWLEDRLRREPPPT